jgi:hypothetical protein
MAHLFLALFLIVFGLNLLFGLSIPIRVTGLLALIASVLLVLERFGVRVDWIEKFRERPSVETPKPQN